MYRSFEKYLYYLLILFIPTQLGKHFWPDFAYVQGIRVDYLSPTIYLTDCIVFLLFSVWFFRKLKSVKREGLRVKAKNVFFQLYPLRFPLSPPTIVFVVISYLLLVILLSGRIMGGLYSLLKLLEMAFVAYYSAKFTSHHYGERFQKVVLHLGIGGIFQSILAITQFVNQGSVGGLLYFLGERTFTSSTPGIANASLNGELVLRPYGTLPHPNVLAGYLLIVLIFALVTFKRSKSTKNKALKVVALIICSIAMFLSMSRIAILLWVIIVGYFLIKKTKQKAYTLIALAISILILLSPAGSRFTKITQADEAITQRAVLIESSFKMIGKNPLLGMGLGNFLPTLATIQKPLSASTYLQPVHNIFLLVATETGLIGLSVFLWFLWKTFKAANGKWQMASGISVCFFAILITGFFDHYWLTLQQGQLLLVFIMGLCWSDFRLSK